MHAVASMPIVATTVPKVQPCTLAKVFPEEWADYAFQQRSKFNTASCFTVVRSESMKPKVDCGASDRHLVGS